MTIEDDIKELGEWKHNIEINGVGTRDINPDDTPVEHHPEPRWNIIRNHIPDNIETAVDLGCSEGRISFELEKMGVKTDAVDKNYDAIRRALYAKQNTSPDPTIIHSEAVKFLEYSDSYDLVLALALPYHVKRLRDLLMYIQERADKKWIIETTTFDVTEPVRSDYRDGKVRWRYSEKWMRSKLSDIGFESYGGRGHRYLIISEDLG